MNRLQPLQVSAAEHSAPGFPTRHLGRQQMTTDTALGVTKRIIVVFSPHSFPSTTG